MADDYEPGNRARNRSPADRRGMITTVAEFRERIGDSTVVEEPSPQGFGHATTSDQVRSLLDVGRIENEPKLGYYAAFLTLCGLPRRNPGPCTAWVRETGPFRLTITAGEEDVGLPYGSIPRLILAWVCTEAVRKQRAEITLAGSLLRFMREIGMPVLDGGGVRGNSFRLDDQARRLFESNIRFEDARGNQTSEVTRGPIARRAKLWARFDQRRRRAFGGVPAQIVLGHEFYEDLLARPVPIDLKVLAVMRRSALGMDLYTWLTHRVFRLHEPARIPWTAIYGQFGPKGPPPSKAALRSFRAKAIRELDKLCLAWRELRYATESGHARKPNPDGYLIVKPPAIPRSLIGTSKQA